MHIQIWRFSIKRFFFFSFKNSYDFAAAQIVRIFFINPCPACRETAKGGEGERDTGITVKGCHQARIARGYLLYLLTGLVERCWEESPPYPYPFWTVWGCSGRSLGQPLVKRSWVWQLILDSNSVSEWGNFLLIIFRPIRKVIQLQNYERYAYFNKGPPPFRVQTSSSSCPPLVGYDPAQGSNSDYLRFFGFLIGRLLSRVRNCYGLAENSEISGRRQVFGLRQRFDHFEHSEPVQTAGTVREESLPIKAGHWGTTPHLETTCTRFINKEENVLISGTREKSAVADSAEPK